MVDRADLDRFQALLADCVVSGDLDGLRRAATELPAPLRDAIGHIDADGFRIAELLVAKLRFERLQQGSARAAEWFREDPRAFTAAFRRYHRDVRPTAHGPRGEADLFEQWIVSRHDQPPADPR